MQVLLALVLVVVFLSTVTLADWCQPTGSSSVGSSGTYCRYDAAYLADGGDGWGVLQVRARSSAL